MKTIFLALAIAALPLAAKAQSCKQMKSCSQAMRAFQNDPSLDRDGDGIPCENVCRGKRTGKRSLTPASKKKPRQSIQGRASVIDGDTIEIHGRRLRIVGIDAPESGQLCIPKDTGEAIRCGKNSADHLAELIGQGPIACEVFGKDKFRRELATCEKDGVDIGAEMILSGHAVAYDKKYIEEEKQAKGDQIGIWGTVFTPPQEWRAKGNGKPRV